jgi:hypothetical protein
MPNRWEERKIKEKERKKKEEIIIWPLPGLLLD